MIEDLLLRLGQRYLQIGRHNDSDSALRLVVPFPTRDDLVRLAFDEISFYGGTSSQVMRRMHPLVADLTRAVPEERRAILQYWGGRLKTTIARSFADDEERLDASKEDRQGIGVPRQHSTG